MSKKRLLVEFKLRNFKGRAELLVQQGLDEHKAFNCLKLYKCYEDQVVYWAVIEKDPAMLKTLLKVGFDPNITCYGQSPLQAAAQYGNIDAVRILCANKKTDINKPHDKSGKTALYLAMQYGHKDICKELMLRGAHRKLSRETRKRLRELALAKKAELDKLYDEEIANRLAGIRGLIKETSFQIKKEADAFGVVKIRSKPKCKKLLNTVEKIGLEKEISLNSLESMNNLLDKAIKEFAEQDRNDQPTPFLNCLKAEKATAESFLKQERQP